jgi:hypothetical protein
MGGIRALDVEYEHNKPIEMNETYYYPDGYEGDKIAASRVEAWEFMVGGGASFNQLNGLFTAEDPAGKVPDNAQLLGGLKILKDFIYSFDFLKMKQDKKSIVSGVPSGSHCRGISEPGQQYALYLHHSTVMGRGHGYKVTPGNYVANLLLNLPGGTYKADWIDSASGKVLRTETFTHQGGDRLFTTPQYTVDIALRIKRS